MPPDTIIEPVDVDVDAVDDVDVSVPDIVNEVKVPSDVICG